MKRKVVDTPVFVALPVLFSGSLWRCRFCSNPYESEMIQELVDKLEDQLQEIAKHNPTVKSLEAFIRKNSKDLHLKHYLNLIGKGLTSAVAF